MGGRQRLLFFALAAVLAGCRVEIFVPEGGRVETQSGAFSCVSGETCTVHVVDLFFDETFVAVADEGYRFQQWQQAHRHFCGGDAGPCRLATTGFEDNPVLEAFLGGDEEFYLQPAFLSIEAKASHTLTAAGGHFQFLNGVVLEVPEGAVDAPIHFTLDGLGPNAVKAALKNHVHALGRMRYLGGFSASPAVTFNKPVTAEIPVLAPGPREVPVLMDLDAGYRTHWLDPAVLEYSADKRVVRTQVHRLAGLAAGAVVDIDPEALEPLCVDPFYYAIFPICQYLDGVRHPTMAFRVKPVASEDLGRYWARLTATGSAMGATGKLRFEYKPAALESWFFVPRTPFQSVTGDSTGVVEEWVYGLQAGTEYDYRACWTEGDDASYCTDALAFTTSTATSLEWIEIDPARPGILVKASGEQFVPWGNNLVRPYQAEDPNALFEDLMYDDAGLALIEEDLAKLLALTPDGHLNSIRLHLQLHTLLLDGNTIDRHAVAMVARLIERIEDRGLYVLLTGLAYHYPGDNPRWIAEQSEKAHWASQALWWRNVAKALRHSPGVFAYDLISEPATGDAEGADGLAEWGGVPHDTYCTFGENPAIGKRGKCFVQRIVRNLGARDRDKLAARWTEKMIRAVRRRGPFQIDTRHLITIGTGGSPRVCKHFKTSRVLEQLSFISPHLYPEAEDNGQAKIDLVAELVALAPGRPVIVGETFPLRSTADTVERVMSQTCNTGNSQGWIGQYDGRRLGEPPMPGQNPFAALLFDAWYTLQADLGPRMIDGGCPAWIP